jgi:uncharacterized protein
VQFGLQFEHAPEPAAGADTPQAADAPPPTKQDEGGPARPVAESKPKPKRKAPPMTVVPTPANPAAAGSDDDPDKPGGGGEVVRLDRFRKK